MMDELKQFFAQPFQEDMDAFHWFLFFGLLICISVLWGFILKHIRGGI